VTDRKADLRGTVSGLPGAPFYAEEPAFVSTPVLALRARFFPDRPTLSLEAWHGEAAAAEITLPVTSPPARIPCPLCHVQTPRIHSRSARTLADLPWGASQGIRMKLRQ